ncbi:Rad17 cell cycle checkpoint protein-domain-containing protein [Xylogone sp. PMI_703]|nr:Rad17 cell cycle checkpoint protein-domain-containing protein [Xylogone sp. PMI_703]
MAPPAKRRKRNVVASSTDESDYESAESLDKPKSKLQTFSCSPENGKSEARGFVMKQAANTISRHQPRTKTTNADPLVLPKRSRTSKTGDKSASTSPEKPKRKGKVEEHGKNANLFTFFTKQAQRQQADAIPISDTSGGRTKLRSFSVEPPEDIDVISDGDDIGEGSAQSRSVIGMTAKRRLKRSDPFRNGEGDGPSTSQKFLKHPKTPIDGSYSEDTRPWAERFAPVDLEELAVHKRKVADVRQWLEDVVNGRRRQRLLLLKGAAGTGKTTTVQLLSKAMDCDILEWRNPVGSIASSDGVQSMAAQFEEFMARGGKFGQLEVISEDDPDISSKDTAPLNRRKRIILIEEFPNTFTRSSTAVQSFRSVILQYLASNTPPLTMSFNKTNNENITPVVLIVSETLLTTTTASADSFTAHRLLGQEILQHPGVGVIEFNPIAPTLLSKALEVIVRKESRKSGRRTMPGSLVLKKLGEIGDIRSAIGSLEFLCLKGDVDGEWSSKISFTKTKKASQNPAALTEPEKTSLEMVTRREASLGIFHAVGKVMYNKREEPASDVEHLPDFISLHSRPKRSQVFVDELIDEIGTDTQTFAATLHENYLLSCDASPSSFEFTSLDHVNGCIDALSDSDLLSPSWDGSFNSTGFGGGIGGQGTGGDVLRQDEISFQIAVRGMLFSLPYPVKRRAPAATGLRTGKGGEAFKMFYPTSLKLWRMKEEIEGSIDLWVTRLIKGEENHLHSITAGAAAFTRPKPGSVENWKTYSGNTSTTMKEGDKKEGSSTALISMGASARKEMLLERLPYMTVIARSRRNSFTILALKDMEKITAFHGIGIITDDNPDDGDDVTLPGEEWATDKPTENGSPRKKGLVIRGRGKSSRLHTEQQEEKLLLSDDDIVDD